MPAKKKSAAHIELGGIGGKPFEMTLDDLLGAAVERLPASKADKALACLMSNGIPAIVEILSEETLAPALTAINPTLKISDLDEACSKLEDLAILILTTARGTRHEISRAHPTATASTIFADEALDIADALEQFDLMDEAELDQNRKLLRSVAGGPLKSVRRK